MRAGDWLFRLLLAVTVLAPLPFGSQRPWAWTLLAVLTGGLLLAWAALAATRRAPAPVNAGRLWFVIASFSVAVGWATLQTLPAAAGLAHPLWAEAAAALGVPTRGAISIDPALGWTALLRLTTYAGVFWLALQLGRDRDRARLGLKTIASAAALYAVYGLVMHFSGHEAILWYAKWAYIGDLTSTFVNRNSYGAYAGIGMICCLALAIQAFARFSVAIGPRLAAERLIVHAGPPLLAAGALATSLMLSHSRGAFLAGVGAILALLAAMAAGRLASRRAVVALAAALAAAGGTVVTVSGDVTLRRLVTQTEIEGDRGHLYRLTADAVADAPWTGHGFGAFASSFRVYRDVSLPRPVVYDFAHNVYLENMMDLGLPAAAALLCAVGGVAWVCLRGLRLRRRDQIYPAVALAAATLIGLHGLVDFSAQIPAVSVTLAFLLGIGCAQAWSTRRRSDDDPKATAESDS